MEIPTVIRRGQSAAERFEALIRPHFDALHRSAYRLTGNVHDAEDLVQEVCVRAYPKLSELEKLDRPRSWLLRVLYRRFVDVTRSWEHSRVRPLSTMEEGDWGMALASSDPGPEDLADGSQVEERLERAWQHLTREQRALLSLHDVEGYSLAELRDITGLRLGTLKSQLHRARVRLGKLLQRESVPVSLVLGGKG